MRALAFVLVVCVASSAHAQGRLAGSAKRSRVAVIKPTSFVEEQRASTPLAPNQTAASIKYKPLNLDDAIEIGLSNATLAIKSETNKEITGADLLLAYGNFLPNLQATAAYGYAEGRQFVGTSSGLADAAYREGQYGVSTSVNLFNGLGDLSRLKAADARDEAAKYTIEFAKQQIAIDIAQAYLQSFLSFETARILDDNLKVSRNRLEFLQAQKSVGAVAVVDLYRQEALTASDEFALANARTVAYGQKLMLLQRLRIDPRENYEIIAPTISQKSIASNFPAESDLLETALKERKDLASQRELAEATDKYITFARRTYFPRLDLVASFGGMGREYDRYLLDGIPPTDADIPPSMWDQLGEQTQGSLMLTLNWQIFDRFVTPNAVRRAKALNRNAEVDLDDQTKLVLAQVRQGYSDYRAALAQVRSTEVGVKSSQKAFEAINARYEVGSSNFLDVTITQASLFQTQLQNAQALVNLKLRSQALLFFTGKDPRGQY